MDTRYRYSFLVVAYNAPNHIKVCLEHIDAACKNRAHEILLVDNGDGSAEKLMRESHPEVCIVPSQGNIGYGAGNNLLASHASGEILIIINPDAYIDAGAIAALDLALGQDRDTAAFAANFLTPDSAPSPENTLLDPTLANTVSLALGVTRLSRMFQTEPPPHPRPIACASGACFAIRREWWDRLGGFDPRFFLYFEEIDLFRRLHKMGGTLTYLPKFIVTHDIGTGDRLAPKRRLNWLRGFMSFCRKHYGHGYASICGAAIMLFALRTHLANSGFRGLSMLHPRNWWRGW